MYFLNHLTLIQVNKDGLKLFTTYMDLLIQEAVGRAETLAHSQSCSEVSMQHIERILVQLMLDFN